MKKIIIIVIIFAVVGVWAWFNLMAPAEIYVNDVSMGFAPNRIIAKKTVNNVIEQKHKTNPKADVNVNVKIKNVSVKYRKCCDDTQLNLLLQNSVKPQIPCNIIVVNGKSLLGLPTKDNVGELLIALKDKYKIPNCEEPEIEENITVDNSSVDTDIFFKTVKEALYYVTEGGGKGQITVITRKPYTCEEIMPPDTVKVSSKKIPYGKQKVISKGKSGKKIVSGHIIFKNGKKTGKEKISEHAATAVFITVPAAICEVLSAVTNCVFLICSFIFCPSFCVFTT